MDNNIFNEIGTTLDLNGPILSLSEQPTGATGIGTTAGATGGGSVSFTGIATGVEPGTGYISYQWYEQDVGKLSDSTYVTGTASTGPVGTAATLTISNLITPRDNQRKFYLVTDYVASAYGTGRSTGNAWNEPLTSGIATATVTPLIEIVSQPAEGVQALVNENATLSVNADLTDSYFADDLIYQWYLNGELAVDGVKTVSTTTGEEVSGEVDFTATRYSSHTFPSVQVDDLRITVAGGSGGNGGHDSGGPGGNGADGRAGRFSFTGSDWLGKTLYTFVGWKGDDGASGTYIGSVNGKVEGVDDTEGDGGTGGKSGGRGWSGAGGGGGALSCISEYSPTSSGIIVAAGGGGGGGGSWRTGGNPGASASVFTQSVGPSDLGGEIEIIKSPHRDGEDLARSGDGGGGGGGGAGASVLGIGGGAGGDHGVDRAASATGGNSGESAYNLNKSTLLSEWTNSGNGYINIKYTGYTSTEVTTTTNTTLSGTNSNTLTIKSDSVGIQTCQCKITSATASNSPIWSDVTNFVTTSTLEQENINVEAIGVGQTASLSSINLSNGDYTFDTTQAQVSSGGITKYYSFYSPDKDIDVEMDLYGGKGTDKGSYNGGEGGYSRVRFTMKQNEEYVIVGLSSDINASYLYRKGQLIACVGGGGDAGEKGHGGNGGGVSVAGERGSGNGGDPGSQHGAGTLPPNGIFGSNVTASEVYVGDQQATGRDGGRVLPCTKGVYWAQQGIGACADMVGENVFRLPDGTVVTNSALITRGFKAGYNIMQTAGASVASDGTGGNGASGGGGGINGKGGGGGSGYTDGSVTIVDTQLGGSTEDAKCLLRIVT